MRKEGFRWREYSQRDNLHNRSFVSDRISNFISEKSFQSFQLNTSTSDIKASSSIDDSPFLSNSGKQLLRPILEEDEKMLTTKKQPKYLYKKGTEMDEDTANFSRSFKEKEPYNLLSSTPLTSRVCESNKKQKFFLLGPINPEIILAKLNGEKEQSESDISSQSSAGGGRSNSTDISSDD